MAKTQVAEAKKNQVGQVLDFSQDAGLGLEGADKNSFAIPFLSILQTNSPQCEDPKDGGIEGARPGMFINTVTNELYQTVKVIPCAYARRFLRWKPRSQGGGYAGEYSPVDVETLELEGLSLINGVYLMDVQDPDKAFDKDGAPLFDRLNDTRNHFVLFQKASGGWSPALLSLASTQIKKSRRWMSMIQELEIEQTTNGKVVRFNPPSFSHIYELGTTKEENAKGKWYGLTVKIEGPVTDAEVYMKAKDFHGQVKSGAVEVTPPPAETGESSGGDSEKF